MISNETGDLKAFNETSGKVDLSLENVRLAETVFSIFYKNSELRDIYKTLEDNYGKETLEEICSVVNRENSTHLRKRDKEIIISKILEECPNINAFKEKLKDKNYPLINIIRFPGDSKSSEKPKEKGDKSSVRDNYSFATKLCHYACYHLFDNDNDRDIYPIYDSVLAKYVTNSEAYKNADTKDIRDYKTYVAIVDRIIEGKGISRNGFDHLIWLATRNTI